MEKKKFIAFIVSFLTMIALISTVQAVIIDGFNDGDFTANPAWEPHSVSGVWSAATFKLVSPNADSNINTDKNFDSSRDLNFSFYSRVNTAGNNEVWFNSPNKTPSGYNITLISSLNVIRFRYDANVIISYATAIANTDYNVSVFRKTDGNFDLLVNGNSVGTAFNSQASIGNGFVVAVHAASGASTGTFDDFNYAQGVFVFDINAPIANRTYTTRLVPFQYRVYDENPTACISFNLDVNEISGVDNNLLIRHTGIPSNPIDANYTLLNKEGSRNIVFSARCATELTLFASSTRSITLDLNSPIIYLFDRNVNSGWDSNAEMDIHYGCTDVVSSTLNYFLAKNRTTLLDVNIAKDTNRTIDTTVLNGLNDLNALCTDSVGRQANSLISTTFYVNQFNLINENTGAAFDLALVNGLTGRSYDTNKVFDFKTAAATTRYFIGSTDDTIRFDINYSDNSTKIYREINQGIVDENIIRVCVAPLQNFFVIDLLSSAERAVQMYNWGSTCYSLADYTKFASGGNLALKAYAIVSSYYLYTVDPTTNAKTLLSLIDGSKVESVNLDLLIFNQRNFDFTFITEDVGFQKIGARTIQIYYKNELADNSIVDFNIFDGSTRVFSFHETANPNELTLNFDYSSIVLDANKLHLVISSTKLDGTTETNDYYFSPQSVAARGAIQNYFAIFLAFLIVLVGLTMLNVRMAYSWWGLFVVLIGAAVMGYAGGEWYIRLFQGIFVFIAIVLAMASKENQTLVN